MKTRLFLLNIFCLLCSLAVQAQADAFFIYRNDGQFNAFFDADVDSITYSHYDADSLYHTDWQMQVIHTADSVYQIPLEVIDSVSLVAPETVLQPGVIEIKDELRDYVVSATDSTVLFSPSTPHMYLPSVGKLVVTTEMSDVFPAGFAGEVVEVNQTDEGYMVECVPADLEDIFESFYSGSYGNSEQTRAGIVESGRKTIGPTTIFAPSPDLQNLSYSVEVSDDYAISVSPYFDFSLTTQFDVSSMVIINKEHGTYITLCCIGDYKAWEKIAFSGKFSYGKDFGLTLTTPPLPICPFVRFYFEPGFFVNASVEGGFEHEWTQHYRSAFLYEYSSKGQEVLKPVNRLIPVKSTHSGEATVKGRIAAGGYAEFGFLIKDKNFLNAHVRAEVGLELESNAVLYKEETNTCRETYATYDKLHDSGIFFNWFFGTAVEAKFLKFTASYDLPWGNKGRMAQLAHVPTFTDVTITSDETDKSKAHASAKVDGGCFVPQSIGLLLLDEDGNEVEKVYHDEKHYIQPNIMEHTFEGLQSGMKYTLYPIVHAYGVEMLASPSVELKANSLCSDANHVHAVDLGLSVKWACHNVGASSPEGYGGYYAWGETEEKSHYDRGTYKYYNNNTGYINIGSNISGTQYDVAHVKWGGSWRMPTLDEIKELVNKCSWKWTSLNGVSGQLVTGPNGNSIFLPAAGCRNGSSLYGAGENGNCWSSTPIEGGTQGAYNLNFSSGYPSVYWIYRFYGRSVRPVSD